MPEISGIIQNYLEGQIKTIGKIPVIQSKNITENGTYTAPEGVDGYSPVVVDVPAPEPVIEAKTITENGTYTAPEGVDGYSPVTVDVPIPSIIPVTLTENGTYTNYDGNGFNPITVAVPSSGRVVVNKYPIVNNRTLQRVPVDFTQGKYYALYYYDDYLYSRSGTYPHLGCTAFCRYGTGSAIDQTLMNYANFNTWFFYTDSDLYLNNKIDNDVVNAYVTIIEIDDSIISPLLPT